jgi:hypothetical protein
MKPLHIPKIRALDLTEGHWLRLAFVRKINSEMQATAARMGLLMAPRPMPRLTGTVTFRRPPPFEASPTIIPPEMEEEWKRTNPRSPYVVGYLPLDPPPPPPSRRIVRRTLRIR